MKFKIKKYLYFINDATNVLLKKDRYQDAEKIKKLRISLIIILVILILSLFFNICLFF